jgi:hypothetical protein
MPTTTTTQDDLAAFNIKGVESSSDITDADGNMHICKVHYELQGQMFQASYSLNVDTGKLRCATLGSHAEANIGQLLSGLVAHIMANKPGVLHAQTH